MMATETIGKIVRRVWGEVDEAEQYDHDEPWHEEYGRKIGPLTVSLSFPHIEDEYSIYLQTRPLSLEIKWRDPRYYRNDPFNVEVELALHLYPWAYELRAGARKTRLYRDEKDIRASYGEP